MRLAYLCNLYPAVSHSFIRREIEAIEGAGHDVHRFSIRPPRPDLKDAADRREAEHTEIILGQGLVQLFLSALALFIAHPLRGLKSMAAAVLLSGPGLQQKVRHVAYWFEAAWLARRVEQLRVEHLHAHFGTNPAAVALIARAWGGPPFSFTAHGPDEFDAPVALSLAAKTEAASFVAAISSYGRSQLMRWSAPVHWPKIRVVRCGVDRDYLDPPVAAVPAQSTEFVCVARLSAQKGLPLLISACDRLRGSGERFSLTIIGGGEMRTELETEIARRNLGGTIVLAGVQTAAEIRAHLNRARAFVLPSFAEGLPVVIMEALALGRPVVCTAIAGIPELVDDECGWLIPAGSEEALVEAMTAALHTSAKTLAAMGETGRARVLELHDSDRNAAAIAAAISETTRPIDTR